MNIEFIRELSALVKENRLYKIEYKGVDGEEIRIYSQEGMVGDNRQIPDSNASKKVERNPESGDKAVVEKVKENIDSQSISEVEDVPDRIKYITSNMIGTFYSKPSPDEKAFVKKGDKISKGDVVCIIESMKLINEVKSPFDCEIVEVVVEDEDIVEFGQQLIKVREIDG